MGFGVVVAGLTFTASPEHGPPPWHGSEIPVDLVLSAVAIAVVTAVWTSRLELKDGSLTATNFFRSRSMPLVEVERVSWSTFAFLGGRLRRADGSGIRTLVSGRTWDELWTPRATKIEREILALAADARGGTAGVGVPPARVPAGPLPGDRFTRVRWREGYDIGEVDAFVGRVVAGTVEAAEVQTIRFTPVRLREGYDMGQVDAYLDGVAADIGPATR